MLYLLGAVLSVSFVGVDLLQIAPRNGKTSRSTMPQHVTEEPLRNMFKRLNLDLFSEPLNYDIKDKWWLTLRPSAPPGTIADVDMGKSANRQRPPDVYPYDPPGGTTRTTWGLYFTGAEPHSPPPDFFYTITPQHYIEYEYTPTEGSTPNTNNIGPTPTTTRYTWSLFYDGSPTTRHPRKTTVSTTEFPSPPTLATTALLNFIDQQKRDMLIYSDGYFSTFLSTLMNIVSDKEDAHLRVLCLSISREYDMLIKEDWFASLGKPFLKVIQDFTVNVGQTPLDYTQHQAMLLSEAIRNRKLVMSKSLSGIIDYIDTLFQENEGIALFNALELVNNYPNTTENPHQVIGKVSAAIFAPYRRLGNTYERQVLIDSITKEIEGHNTLEDRRNAYRNGLYYRHRRIQRNRTRFAIVDRDSNKVVKEDVYSTNAAEDNSRGLTRSSKWMKRNQKRKEEVGAPSRTVYSIRGHTKPVYGIEYVNPVRYKMVTRRLPTFATSKLNNQHTRTSTPLQNSKLKHPKKRIAKDSTKGVQTSVAIKDNAFASKDIGRTVKHYQKRFLIKSRPKETVDSNQLDKDRASDRESQGEELAQDSNKDIKTQFYEINQNAYTAKNCARTREYTQNKFMKKKRLKKTIENDPPSNARESERENQGAELAKDKNKGVQTEFSEINEKPHTSKRITKTRGYKQLNFVIKKRPKKTTESDPPSIDRESEPENRGAELVQDSNKSIESPIYEIDKDAYTSKNIARTKGYKQLKFVIKKRPKKTIDSHPPGKDSDSEFENQVAKLLQELNKDIQTPFYEKNQNAYTSKNIGRTQEQIQKRIIMKKRPKITIGRDSPNKNRDPVGEIYSTKLVQVSTKDIRTPSTKIDGIGYTRNNIGRIRNNTQKRFIIKKRPKNTSDSNKFEASAALSVEVSSTMSVKSFYSVTTKPKPNFKRTPITFKLDDVFKFKHAFVSSNNSSEDHNQIGPNRQNIQKEIKPKNLNNKVYFKPFIRRDRLTQTINSTSAKISLNKLKAFSSYSDEENSLKFHLLDALRHDTYSKNARRFNQDNDTIHPTKKKINELSSYSGEEAALKVNIYKELGFNDDYKKTKLSDIVKRVNDNFEANIKGETNKPVNGSKLSYV